MLEEPGQQYVPGIFTACAKMKIARRCAAVCTLYGHGLRFIVVSNVVADQQQQQHMQGGPWELSFRYIICWFDMSAPLFVVILKRETASAWQTFSPCLLFGE